MRKRKLPSVLQAFRRLIPTWRFCKWGFWFFLAGAAGGVSIGLFLTRDIPELETGFSQAPPLTTRIYSRDGEVIQEYAEEKRVLTRYGDISPHFIDALVATEDAGFFRHYGISPRGILRALIADLRQGNKRQGGSTLTQQLARGYFLTPRRTYERKIKEMILAVNIEHNYSKEEILEMYCNKVAFGHGHYGVESAAEYFFGKPARDLTIPEGALLAGMIQRPTAYSPRFHPKDATRRRNHVLKRMFITGKITEKQYGELRKAPLGIAPPPLEERGVGAYISERVRIYIEDTYGEEALYSRGFHIHTTVDTTLQTLAQQAIRDGLHEYDHRHGYRGPKRGEDAPKESLAWPAEAGDRLWATVTRVTKDRITAALGGHEVTLGEQEWSWVRNLKPDEVFEVDDRVLLHFKEGGPEPVFELDQRPIAQAALVALDPSSGEVRAMVGGYEFSSSMFNRAIQAKRQTGSAVKPLLYTTALANGTTWSHTVIDEPRLFLTGREHAEKLCEEGYRPRDFDPSYMGLIPYRKALERSVNIPAVHLLNQTGYSKVIDMARRLHISTELQPYPSLALGAFSITLWELTSAYATLANRGVWIEPRFISRIKNHEGRILKEFRPQTEAAVDPAVAYVMISGLQGVVKRGTARRIASLPGHFAGKTGTTNDYTDSWFMGFNPALACGVWAGRDDNLSLGKMETGSRVALPIWKRFMEPATRGQEDLDFPEPEGIVKVLVDPLTGLRAGMDSPCTDIREEVFLEGTEPTRFCTHTDHFRLRLPYYLQVYPIGPDLRLSIPADDLQHLVDTRPGMLRWNDAGRILSVTWRGATFPVGVRVEPARDPLVPQAVMPDLPPEGSFSCGARVEYVNEKL